MVEIAYSQSLIQLKPPFSGHPRGTPRDTIRWPLDGGWPLKQVTVAVLLVHNQSSPSILKCMFLHISLKKIETYCRITFFVIMMRPKGGSNGLMEMVA